MAINFTNTQYGTQTPGYGVGKFGDKGAKETLPYKTMALPFGTADLTPTYLNPPPKVGIYDPNTTGTVPPPTARVVPPGVKPNTPVVPPGVKPNTPVVPPAATDFVDRQGNKVDPKTTGHFSFGKTDPWKDTLWGAGFGIDPSDPYDLKKQYPDGPPAGYGKDFFTNPPIGGAATKTGVDANPQFFQDPGNMYYNDPETWRKAGMDMATRKPINNTLGMKTTGVTASAMGVGAKPQLTPLWEGGPTDPDKMTSVEIQRYIDLQNKKT